MRLLNIIFYVAFLLSVLVQYNDPDPFEWMAAYSLAALVCVLFAARMLRPWFAGTVAVAALVWCLVLAGTAMSSRAPISTGDVFGTTEMKNERVELAREAGGLAIVVFWCGLLAWRVRGRERG